MDIDRLVKLTSRAWSLNILARMKTGTPGRQAALLASTGASRTALAHSLHHLIDLGFVERSPGHGHPLRPEFRLTSEGWRAAAIAESIVGAAGGKADIGLVRRAWTVPILAVCQGPRYFSEIRSVLSPITDRALSQSLKQLQSQRWLERETVLSISPLRSRYIATNAGREIANAVGLSVNQ